MLVVSRGASSKVARAFIASEKVMPELI